MSMDITNIEEMRAKFANGEYAYVYVMDYTHKQICEYEGDVLQFKNGQRMIYKKNGERLTLGKEGEIKDGRIIWFSYPDRNGAIYRFKIRLYKRMEDVCKDANRKLKIIESL